MGYLIQQILLCLIIAAILGFVIGWLLRGISAKEREQYLIEHCDKRMQALKKRLKSRASARTTNVPVTESVVKTIEPDQETEPKQDDEIHEAHIDDYFIEAIEEIGQERGIVLREMGVSMVQQFLIKYQYADESRTELAEKLEIDEETVRRWVSMADLMRIQGVGSQYSELLEASGVHSVPALVQQDAEQLAEKMKLVNRAEHSTILTLPDAKQVATWIEIAKSLPSVITV